jgi:hypothetical protein
MVKEYVAKQLGVKPTLENNATLALSAQAGNGGLK